jgi:glycosyltransferase involved in cell wall biosynthesis
MRVLHVIPSISPRRGGPSAAIIPMVSSLRSRGIDAEIATTDEDFEDLGAQGPEPLLQTGAPVRFFPRVAAPFRALREFSCSPRFTAWLETSIRDYDLLHVHALFSHLPTTAMRSARRHGLPYISRPLGQLGTWPLQQSALRKKIYLRVVEAENLRSAAALHFTSTTEKSEANLAGFASSGFVIPHGIELPVLIPHARELLRHELNLAPNRKIILFLGRIHRKKGLDLLLTALSRLDRDVRPLLLLAGEGPHRHEIEQLVAGLNVVPHVRWLEQVTGDRKQLCLQGADLFALTSHHENLGVAVLEALAAGTPVLISNEVALAAEIAERELGTVVPLHVEAIARALPNALAPSPELSRERRRDFVRTSYSWPANSAALAKLYENIIEKSRSPKRDRAA